MSLFGVFSGDKSTSSTTSNNDSRNQSWTDSHNTTSNLSLNTTDTLTQDRRLVVDNGGYGVSADNSTITTANSNNSSSVSTNIDSHNITYTDYGSVAAAIAANKDISGKAIDVSKAVVDNGRQMMQANLDYLQHVGEASLAQSRDAIREVASASSNALNQVVGIAAKPLNANDPQRLVIIVALGVLGVVFFSKMKG
ncbi:MAG: hypothetical protein ACJ8LG_21640 [Massilia sp.]